jgi:hypothetical protein
MNDILVCLSRRCTGVGIILTGVGASEGGGTRTGATVAFGESIEKPGGTKAAIAALISGDCSAMASANGTTGDLDTL